MSKLTDKIKKAVYEINYKKDKALLYAFAAVTVGFISGAAVTNIASSVTGEAADLFVSFFTDFSDKSRLEIFSGLALEGIIYFLALFIAGSNIFGKELTLLLTALKASGITAIISVLYSNYGLKGLEYTLLVFLPGKTVLFFTMLFMTKFCYEFSADLRREKACLKETKAVTGVFAVKSIIALLIMLLSWLTDFLCITVFSGLFSFTKQ